MADYSNYSFDIIKKIAFEKEIDTIKNSHANNLSEYEELLINYMAHRIEQIDEEYKDT